ncbi:NlpC/P60 family protein [Robertmurraya sp. DFI.2.37]|uniref:C40 family peptidase n=1 Tax=Robertmurraya sp. DFI.2.37 TaxID=3031819 RepID=UPI001248437C|nr:C40 family peptidase [Robertmurraya sp. DFI.2.37]MDF1507063.1 NlpC/P60 family protein [Robertmurraya sp. DFI.2.37]
MGKQFLKMIVLAMFILGITIGETITANAQVEQVPTAGIAINGKIVNGINPIKMDGVYYLPFVQLAKILGYNYIKFDEKTLTYEVTDGSTTIRTTMGGTQAKKGNEYVNIKAPRWINQTAYISLHAGGALFNSYITFNKSNGSIQVQKPAEQYVVHSGDSLWNISLLHHTTVSELKAVNNLTSNIIKDGQVLKLPNSGSLKEMEPVKENEPVKNNNRTSVATQRQKLLEAAKQYIGAGYKYGATLAEAPKLFDCSSYTQLVFKQVGIDIPRVSRDQASKGTTVTNLQAGDLMFFTLRDTYSDGRVAHVGIYMGDGSMIHASTSLGVAITKNVMQNSYWSRNYLFSKRVIQ